MVNVGWCQPHLKNILAKFDHFPQVGLKILRKWNHQLGIELKRSLFGNTPFAPLTLVASPLVSSHHQQTAASGRAMEHCPTAQHSNSGDRTTFQNRNSSNERQDFRAKKHIPPVVFFGSRNIDATFGRTVILAIDEEYILPDIHPLKLCCSSPPVLASQGLHVHVLIIHDLKLLICQYIRKGKTWNLSTNSHHWHWKIHSENGHDNGKTTHLIWRIEEIPTKIMISHCHLSFFGGCIQCTYRTLDMDALCLAFLLSIHQKGLELQRPWVNMKLIEYAGVCTVISIYIYVNICINVIHVWLSSMNYYLHWVRRPVVGFKSTYRRDAMQW